MVLSISMFLVFNKPDGCKATSYVPLYKRVGSVFALVNAALACKKAALAYNAAELAV